MRAAHAVRLTAPLRPPAHGHAASPDRSKDTTRPLSFTAFVEILLDWVAWWNTEHTSQALDGRTPLAAWQSDPTRLQEADPALL
ncbi:hypothetical protein J7E97_29185 [Streptomyces sp. ISL-66]|nr:hypothetical protein [Streptomyces sp. ISL-66]MBT2471828.1 hypothetical protein [Streptomyces sp. ISL-66]